MRCTATAALAVTLIQKLSSMIHVDSLINTAAFCAGSYSCSRLQSRLLIDPHPAYIFHHGLLVLVTFPYRDCLHICLSYFQAHLTTARCYPSAQIAAVSLKRCKVGSKLPLTTNRNMYIRAYDWYQNR